MKKKIAAAIVSLVLLLTTLCSCSEKRSENDSSADGSKISVVSTIFASYDFTRQIGGDNIELTMLLKPGMESHDYDPTPKDIINIRNADLFIYVGGESDEWVNDILESNEQKPKKVISLMSCVDNVQEETVEGMETEEENSDGKAEYDEHVWTSPKNAVIITKKISEALKELDKENAPKFEKNTVDYCTRLSSLDNEFKNVVANAKRKTLIFGDRFPFRYFVDEYELKYYAAFPGCASESEPSASTVSFLIEKVREEKIPVVFTIEFSSGKVADVICESTDAKKRMFHSCHNITQEEFNDGVTYIELMNENLKNLKEALY